MSTQQQDHNNEHKYDALALFSGGLDSILAVKLIQQQNLRVLALHFFSPFFGKPHKIQEWEKEYGFEILPIDVGEEFIKIVKNPKHGHGSYLNPCIDCKILMIKKAKELLPLFNAKFIITGEVIGQRPMSQRKDTMNLIKKEAGVEDLLLRPLCAKNLPPTQIEKENIVDRSKLLDLRGRSRKRQLEIAKKFNIKKIPTPAGGCLLTDPEMANRFKKVLANIKDPSVYDFEICKIGRHFWSNKNWLIIGRNHKENLLITKMVREIDIVLKLSQIPGPIGLIRAHKTKTLSPNLIYYASQLIIKYSKAKSMRRAVKIQIATLDVVKEQEVIPELNTLLDKNPWIGPI